MQSAFQDSIALSAMRSVISPPTSPSYRDHDISCSGSRTLCSTSQSRDRGSTWSIFQSPSFLDQDLESQARYAWFDDGQSLDNPSYTLSSIDARILSPRSFVSWDSPASCYPAFLPGVNETNTSGFPSLFGQVQEQAYQCPIERGGRAFEFPGPVTKTIEQLANTNTAYDIGLVSEPSQDQTCYLKGDEEYFACIDFSNNLPVPECSDALYMDRDHPCQLDFAESAPLMKAALQQDPGTYSLLGCVDEPYVASCDSFAGHAMPSWQALPLFPDCISTASTPPHLSTEVSWFDSYANVNAICARAPEAVSGEPIHHSTNVPTYLTQSSAIAPQNIEALETPSLQPAFNFYSPTMSLLSADTPPTIDHEFTNNKYRAHPLYNCATVDPSDGLYHCPFSPVCSTSHPPTKLKCNYDKFLDSHLKPYRCRLQSDSINNVCSTLRFSSTACQLRHEREAHALHGHGEKPYLCKHVGCDRGIPGHGFPRRWNCWDHMRRVHGVISGGSIDEDEHETESRLLPQTDSIVKRSISKSTRKRKTLETPMTARTEADDKRTKHAKRRKQSNISIFPASKDKSIASSSERVTKCAKNLALPTIVGSLTNQSSTTTLKRKQMLEEKYTNLTVELHDTIKALAREGVELPVFTQM